jgi:hypothetical protein
MNFFERKNDHNKIPHTILDLFIFFREIRSYRYKSRVFWRFRERLLVVMYTTSYQLFILSPNLYLQKTLDLYLYDLISLKKIKRSNIVCGILLWSFFLSKKFILLWSFYCDRVGGFFLSKKFIGSEVGKKMKHVTKKVIN